MDKNKETKIGNQIKIFNFNEVYIPKFDERPSKDWITWGENNLFPQFLITLLNRSAKHRAIVETKAKMIGGNEWNKNGLDAATINFIKNANNRIDLDEILARISFDLEVHGAFCLNVIWSKDRSKISQIHYVDPSKVRIKVRDEDDKGVDQYWISDDWSKGKRSEMVLYHGFDSVDRSKASQILFVKQYSPGCEYYTVPNYIAANNWIELEWEITNFHLTQVKRGFHPALIINFNNGIPSDEEMQMVNKRMKDQFAGSNGEPVYILYGESKDNSPVITPITLNDSDKRFIELNKSITEGIMSGHQVVNPSLFGIKTEGQLGNTNEILDNLRVFDAQYVVPRQKLIEKVFNKLAKLNGLTTPLEINKFELQMEVQVNSSDIISILTSTISDDQKIEVFKSVGYTEEQANKLVFPTGRPDSTNITK